MSRRVPRSFCLPLLLLGPAFEFLFFIERIFLLEVGSFILFSAKIWTMERAFLKNSFPRRRVEIEDGSKGERRGGRG